MENVPILDGEDVRYPSATKRFFGMFLTVVGAFLLYGTMMATVMQAVAGRLSIPVLVSMGLLAGGVIWSGTRLTPRWRRGFGITLSVLGLSSFGNILAYHAQHAVLAATVALGLVTEAIGVHLILAQRRRDRKLRGTNMTEPKAL